jgi:hypothetical protein
MLHFNMCKTQILHVNYGNSTIKTMFTFMWNGFNYFAYNIKKLDLFTRVDEIKHIKNWKPILRALLQIELIISSKDFQGSLFNIFFPCILCWLVLGQSVTCLLYKLIILYIVFFYIIHDRKIRIFLNFVSMWLW